MIPYPNQPRGTDLGTLVVLFQEVTIAFQLLISSVTCIKHIRIKKKMSMHHNEQRMTEALVNIR